MKNYQLKSTVLAVASMAIYMQYANAEEKLKSLQTEKIEVIKHNAFAGGGTA